VTERIQSIKSWQWEHKHHAFRQDKEISPDVYRVPGMADYTRTALRLKTALDNEIPVLAPGEIIAFTRTVPNLPMIFTDEEWAEITAKHFIHEKGNVTNLSPGYAEVIAEGLKPLRDRLDSDPYH